MKKNIIISLLLIIILIQFLALKNINPVKTSSLSQNGAEDNKSSNLSASYLMNNPIDNYYALKLNSKTEAEVRDAQEEYETTWKQEYNKVIALLNSKCLYAQDKETLISFENSVENLIEAAKPVLETEFSEAYQESPDIPGNRSLGNSTASALQGINGQIYRDISMLLIPYLKGEYEFPVISEN